MQPNKLKSILKQILIISLTFCGFAWSKDTSAEKVMDTGNTEPHRMEEVVVSATRFETPGTNVTANIDIITKEDIEKMPVTTVAEVLQYIPGVYIEFNGGPGSNATATIQGSQVTQVSIYRDGVPLNQLANPMTDLSYLYVDTIERIEVYKGAASSAWGSSLGGVINIVTKEPDPQKTFTGDARISYGTNHSSKNHGSFTGTIEKFSYLCSFAHNKSDGFFEHTEYDNDSAYAKLNYYPSETTLINFIYSYEKGRNADPVLNFPGFWDDSQMERHYQRLMFEFSPTDTFLLTIEGRHHKFENKIEDVFPRYRLIYNDYEDELWGGSARINWDVTDNNSLVIGYDGDWGEYEWNNYAKEYDTGNWAAFVNDTITAGNFSFNVGMRLDDNDDFGSEFSSSGGIVYRFSEDRALIRAQVAKGFSAPPPAMVHALPPYGNPDLEPEIAINYQLGGEIQAFKFLRFELNLFYADVEDLITYVYNPDPEVPRFINMEEVTRQGFEGNITAAFDWGLKLSFGGSFVDVKDEQTDMVIKDIPRRMLTITSTYRHQLLTHSLHGKYIDHNSSYIETRDRKFVFDYLLDIKMPFFKKVENASLFGAVYNIFNTRYLYRSIWPKPGRWAEIGVRFEF